MKAIKAEVAEWLEAAPTCVKVYFGNTIAVQNFWREDRNRHFQMPGKYDGAISDEAAELSREFAEICETIIEVTKHW